MSEILSASRLPASAVALAVDLDGAVQDPEAGDDLAGRCLGPGGGRVGGAVGSEEQAGPEGGDVDLEHLLDPMGAVEGELGAGNLTGGEQLDGYRSWYVGGLSAVPAAS